MAAVFPFNLDGPSFLQFYGALSVTALALLAWRVHRRASSSQPERGERGEPDTYQIAWLAGGAQATLNAALASLMARGALEKRGKSLAPRTPSNKLDALHPVESEVLRHVALGLPAALRGLASAPLGLERSLSQRGLYRAARPWLEAAPELIALIGGVLLLGLARVAQGLSAHRPVGFLVLEMVLVALIGVAIAASYRRGARTAAGEALLARMRRSTPRKLEPSATASALAVDPALPVALFGTAVLMGTPLGGVHEQVRRNLRASDASGSGCSGGTAGDSGGSGCSGSGCGSGCGGGCGGCSG
jgi:uncharacterized protein (TIGR04222 family)